MSAPDYTQHQLQKISLAPTGASIHVANVIKGCRPEPIAFYEARILHCCAIDGVGLKANLACCFRII